MLEQLGKRPDLAEIQQIKRKNEELAIKNKKQLIDMITKLQSAQDKINIDNTKILADMGTLTKECHSKVS